MAIVTLRAVAPRVAPRVYWHAEAALRERRPLPVPRRTRLPRRARPPPKAGRFKVAFDKRDNIEFIFASPPGEGSAGPAPTDAKRVCVYGRSESYKHMTLRLPTRV